MGMLARLRRLSADERGANVVEYAGVTGVALLIAGILIVALMNGRFMIGGVMANHLDRIITSFESGQPGTANTYTSLYPRVNLPDRELLIPNVTVTSTLPEMVVGVPRMVNQVVAPVIGPQDNQHTIVAPAEQPALVVAPALGVPAITSGLIAPVTALAQLGPALIGSPELRNEVINPAATIPNILLPIIGVPAIIH